MDVTRRIQQDGCIRKSSDGWGIINGPGSLLDRLNAKKGFPRITEMPNATNIIIGGHK